MVAHLQFRAPPSKLIRLDIYFCDPHLAGRTSPGRDEVAVDDAPK
jgi:hypothetical protein